jgi:hypothetical protein
METEELTFNLAQAVEYFPFLFWLHGLQPWVITSSKLLLLMQFSCLKWTPWVIAFRMPFYTRNVCRESFLQVMSAFVKPLQCVLFINHALIPYNWCIRQQVVWSLKSICWLQFSLHLYKDVTIFYNFDKLWIMVLQNVSLINWFIW